MCRREPLAEIRCPERKETEDMTLLRALCRLVIELKSPKCYLNGDVAESGDRSNQPGQPSLLRWECYHDAIQRLINSIQSNIVPRPALYCRVPQSAVAVQTPSQAQPMKLVLTEAPGWSSFGGRHAQDAAVNTPYR